MANGGVGFSLPEGVTNNYVSDNTRLGIVAGINGNLNFKPFRENNNISDLVIRGVAQAASHGVDQAVNAGSPVYEAFLRGQESVNLIPEPSTWIMTIMGASLLLSLQRFRKKKG